jgi:S1-C subfamily serine protease
MNLIGKYFILFILFFSTLTSAENISNVNNRNATITKAKAYTCLVEICQFNSKDTFKIKQGTGAIVKYKIADNKYFYFCLTVCHVVQPLLKDSSTFCEIVGITPNGLSYRASGAKGNAELIWADEKKDMAIIRIKTPLPLLGQTQTINEIPVLNGYMNSDDVSLGDEVYMMGYRLLNQLTYNFIVKEGMVAASIGNHPLLDNIPVFYIDKMANKGMSGGTVFYENGKGLGIMEGYVLESGNPLGMSDDLTIVIPFYLYFKVLDQLTIAGRLLP